MSLRALRVLLRPGWIVGAVAVAAFAVACFGVMAPWQFGKGEAVERRAALIAQAFATPAVPWAELQVPGSALDADDEWREVIVQGRYLTDHDMVLRAGGKVEDHALTPFELTDGQAVILIDRGAAAQETVTDAGSTGDTVVQARLRAPENTSRYKPPRTEEGMLVASAIDPVALGEATGLELAPYYLQVAPDTVPAEALVPAPDTLPHVSYGVQWTVFGVLVPVAFAVSAARAVLRAR